MTRPLPLLGKPLPEWRAYVCGYSPTPDDPVCSREAVWHGFVMDDEITGIVAMMACCDEHLDRMKLTADYIHRLKHPCCIPGSKFRWPENECYTEWDESAEFAVFADLVASP